MKRTSTGYKTACIVHDYFSYENLQKHPERMVVVGFLAADGCINDKRVGQRELVVRLSKKDRVITDRLNLEIADNTRPVWEDKVSFCVSFPSNQICSDLARYGIVPRKTATLELPNLPDDLMPYFVRGYFYGDGCVYGKKGRRRYDFISNAVFISQLQIYLLEKGIVERCFVRPTRNPIYANLDVYGSQAHLLSNWLFASEKMNLLPRKHIKTEKLVGYTQWTKAEEDQLYLLGAKEFSKMSGRGLGGCKIRWTKVRKEKTVVPADITLTAT